MFLDILNIEAADFFHLKRVFSYYDADNWYGNKPKTVFHTLSSFQDSDGNYYFRLDLIYNTETARKVREIFGDLASYNKEKRYWKIQAFPSIIDSQELLNKMRRFTSSLNKYFLAPSFYDLVDKIKEQNKNKESINE